MINKKSKLNWMKIFLVCISATVLGILSAFLFKEFYPSVFSNISSRNEKTSDFVSYNFNRFLDSKKAFEKEYFKNKILEKKLSEYEKDIEIMRQIIKDNDYLAKLYKLKKDKFNNAILAKVVSRSPNNWYKELIIDKGFNEGLKVGMIAVTDKGILGQISRVEKTYSIVSLIRENQVKFGAEISRSKVTGIIFGTDNLQIAKLRFVPIGSDIKKGDIVQTSSISATEIFPRVFPSAYPFGKVIKIRKDKNNSELEIFVRLFEDTSTVKKVLILR